MMRKKVFIITIPILILLSLLGVNRYQLWLYNTPTEGNKIEKYSNPKKALLVVDIQEDVTGKTAKPPYPYARSLEFINNVNTIIDKAENKEYLIVYIKQEFDNNIFSKFISNGIVIKDSAGAQLDSKLHIKNNNIFSKSHSDAFSNKELENILIKNSINEIYITGLDATACVYKTGLGALNRGYKVKIVSDGIITFGKPMLVKMLSTYKNEGLQITTSNNL